MTAPLSDTGLYTDVRGLNSLKQAAKTQDSQAVRETARQFESLFTSMMLKSMREANFKDPNFGSDQGDFYQGMFDDQLAVQMSHGRGLGLADMLVRQLQRLGVAGPVDSVRSSGGTSPTAPASPGHSGDIRSSAATSMSSRPVGSAEQASFIRELWPEAQQAARQLGVDPRGVLAQAALETKWGRSVPRDASGGSSNNLFGMKATSEWGGARVSAATQEFQNGTAAPTAAQFRVYDSRVDSFRDYVSMLSANPRYTAALHTGGNVEAFAAALQRGGYATDPDYARKLSAIASTLNLGSASSGSLKSADAVPMYAEVAQSHPGRLAGSSQQTDDTGTL